MGHVNEVFMANVSEYLQIMNICSGFETFMQGWPLCTLHVPPKSQKGAPVGTSYR